ncbi:MAG: M20/M25/M40 family metallo-hydrolase [Candidatus Lokiarchaeota archaeon]|nr:M20/M25/M40 family metallo-hydrolase [Candidatus Lokiarchaeota archaeon]
MVEKEQTPLHRLDLFTKNDSVINETIELLQLMIQTDTTNPPGNEIILAKKLQELIQKEKCDYISTKIIETYSSRGNLILTVHGTAPEKHPTWGFHGHLDVVRAEGDWKYPPFSGELVQLQHDKFIWGRGAIDMKKQCAAHLMAVIQLVRQGWRPKGDVKLIYTADEEAGGKQGAKILISEYYEEVKVDCMIDEAGGENLPFGRDFIIQRGEKGKLQMDLTFHGKAGHGSMPMHLETYAIYKLVKVLNKIRRRKQPLYINTYYRQTIDALSIPQFVKFLLKRKLILRPIITIAGKIYKIDIGKILFSLLTDTIAPTIIKAGEKVNVISPSANLSLDIRILPGHDQEFVLQTLKKKLGLKLFEEIEFYPIDVVDATISSIETPYYDKIQSVFKEMYTGAKLVPMLGVGGTDSKYWRKKGIPCYGFSPLLLDKDLTYNELMGLMHAPNERVSVTNLMFATEFAYRLMREL